MTTTDDDCLDESDAAAYAEGSASPQAAARAEAHMDRCGACRWLVSELARQSQASDGAAVAGEAATAATEAATEAALSPYARGAQLGRFVVLDTLGVGGMGIVLAAYDPTLDRRVALKLLRPGTWDETARTRLQREAQAMARLSHPNVVTVFEAGAVGEHLYVAMEFVEGETLRSWLAREARPWRQVLDAFLAAGRGVAAAHAAGLVHRDLKPENILVGHDGRVRVTDFGLASVSGRAVPSRVDLATLSSADLAQGLTRAGAVMGTPAYMAPEQHQGLALVDARADQFAFCVSLYEGLYGERPFAGDTYPVLVDAVMNGRVRPPSPEREVPAWLRRVVLHGLSVAADARHESMAALLNRLTADPGRRRRRLAATVVVGIAIVVGLPAAFYAGRSRSSPDGVVSCAGGRARLAGVWDANRREALRTAFARTGAPSSGPMWTYVADKLDRRADAWARSYTEACEATRVRHVQSEQALDLRMQCLDRRRREVEVLVHLLSEIDAEAVARASSAVSELPAIDGCDDVAALSAPIALPADAAERERIAELRARIAGNMAMMRLGRWKAAREAIDGIVGAAKQTAYVPLQAESLYQLGYDQERAGQIAEAKDTLHEAISTAERARDDLTKARAWGTLAYILAVREAHHADAEEAVRFAAAALERHGEDLSARATLLATESIVLSAARDKVRSTERGREALRLLEQIHGPRDIQVANMLITLSRSEADPASALQLLARALDIYEGAAGRDHPTVATVLVNMGTIASKQRDNDRALGYFQEALAIRERALGPDHAEVAMPALNVGEVLRETGRCHEAMAHYRRALALWEKALAHDHPYLADALTGLGRCLITVGRPGEALAPLERALAIRERGDAVSPAERGDTRFALAQALWATKSRRAQARALAARAEQDFAAAGDEATPARTEVAAWLTAHR